MSTFQIFQQGINSIVDHQAKIAETDLRIATGKRVLKPSDDPTGSVRIHDLKAEIDNLSQITRNIENARGRLAVEESVLGQVGNVLQRFQELVVQANNDALGETDRRAIAVEMTSLRTEMLTYANTRDASGEYLFAGFQVATQPFAMQGGAVAYNADQGERLVNIGSGVQIALGDNGFDVFQNIRGGTGVFEATASTANFGDAIVSAAQAGEFVVDSYTLRFSQATPMDPMTYVVEDSASNVVASGNYVSGESIVFSGVSLDISGSPASGDTISVDPATGRDVFSTMKQAIDVLNGEVVGGNANGVLHNGLNQVLNNLDQAEANILDVRAGVGARINSLDAQQNLHEANLLNLQTSLSDIEDIDMVKAINDLNMQRISLQAAQQAYLQIRDLSIFSFL